MTRTGALSILASALLEAFVRQMYARVRQTTGLLGAAALLIQPLAATPAPSSTPLGTIVYAERANVGTSAASLGSTLFGGDRISTDSMGTVQVRTAAARLKLSQGSSAILLEEPGSAGAILTAGMATFSTASANAFALHAFAATIKPNSDEPTVGQVMILGKNEIYLKSTRGALVCSVDGEDRIIPEGDSYRVVLDSAPGPHVEQGPAGVGAKGNHYPPLKGGRSRAIYFIAAGVAALTIYAVHEAYESPDRP